MQPAAFDAGARFDRGATPNIPVSRFYSKEVLSFLQPPSNFDHNYSIIEYNMKNACKDIFKFNWNSNFQSNTSQEMASLSGYIFSNVSEHVYTPHVNGLINPLEH